MEHDDYDSDAMFLGRVLRRARVAAGITSQEELARRLGFERTVIAKAESGQRPPSPEVAAAYAREFPQLNALVEGGLIEEWAEHVKKNGRPSFPEFFVDWIDAEKNAATLFYWAPTLVPGLLQVESYARVILATEPDETESLDVLLAGRMGRQQVLSRPQPPAVTVVMAEAVLHRGVGGPAVMYEQLTHLAEESQQPKVMIQVIPAEVSAHAGLGGAASIADREGEATVVHLDSFTAPQTTRAPEIVAKVRQRSDMLRGEALPRSASHELNNEGGGRRMETMNWRKSTYSSGNGGECVEVAGHANRVLVRDTKDRSGPVLRFTPGAWRRFADRVKRPLAGPEQSV